MNPNVNYSILSLVALATIITDAQDEMRLRLAGMSDPDANLRNLLVTDAMNHGVSEETANSEIDSWLESGYTLEDVARLVAVDDAAIGDPSVVLPNPDPLAVVEQVDDMEEAEFEAAEFEEAIDG